MIFDEEFRVFRRVLARRGLVSRCQFTNVRVVILIGRCCLAGETKMAIRSECWSDRPWPPNCAGWNAPAAAPSRTATSLEREPKTEKSVNSRQNSRDLTWPVPNSVISCTFGFSQSQDPKRREIDSNVIHLNEVVVGHGGVLELGVTNVERVYSSRT